MTQLKILIVEDDINIAKLLNKYLSAKGYTVLMSGDGLEGVKTFREKRPDLVLLDILLPKLMGYDVCDMIRKMEEDKRTPIIMMSGVYSVEKYHENVHNEERADLFLAKPFQFAEMLRSIQRLLKEESLETEELEGALDMEEDAPPEVLEIVDRAPDDDEESMIWSPPEIVPPVVQFPEDEGAPNTPMARFEPDRENDEDLPMIELEPDSEGDDDLPMIELEPDSEGDDDLPMIELEPDGAGDSDLPMIELEPDGEGDDDLPMIALDRDRGRAGALPVIELVPDENVTAFSARSSDLTRLKPPSEQGLDRLKTLERSPEQDLFVAVKDGEAPAFEEEADRVICLHESIENAAAEADIGAPESMKQQELANASDGKGENQEAAEIQEAAEVQEAAAVQASPEVSEVVEDIKEAGIPVDAQDELSSVNLEPVPQHTARSIEPEVMGNQAGAGIQEGEPSRSIGKNSLLKPLEEQTGIHIEGLLDKNNYLQLDELVSEKDIDGLVEEMSVSYSVDVQSLETAVSHKPLMSNDSGGRAGAGPASDEANSIGEATNGLSLEEAAAPADDPSMGAYAWILSDHERMQKSNYFQILGVSESANDDEIEAAYFDLMKKYSPTVFGKIDSDMVKKKAKANRSKISQAFGILSDPEERVRYQGRLSLSPIHESGDADIAPLSDVENFMRGIRQLEESDFIGALSFFAKASQLNPRESKYYAYYGWAMYNQNKDNDEVIGKALQFLRQALAMDSTLDMAYTFIGQIHLALKEYEDARHMLAQALLHNPMNEEAHRVMNKLESL